MNKEPPFMMKIVEVVDNDDDTATAYLELEDGFKTWFCESNNLQEFDQKVFEKWFIEAITEALNKVKEGNIDGNEKDNE